MATFTVDTLADIQNGNYGAGNLSLREALLLANNTAAADTIVFSNAIAGGTIVLTAGELALTQATVIDGDTNGDDKADITISGDDSSRVFNVSANDTTATFKSLTLTNGNAGGGFGGAVLGGQSDLRLENTTIRDSVAGDGGAIHTIGNMAIVNSTIHGNHASGVGGGIYSGGVFSLVNSTIYGNEAARNGGGVYVFEGSMSLENSTMTANRCNADGAGSGTGGAIDVYGSSYISARNSVIADNFTGLGALEDDVSALIDLARNSVFGTDVGISTNLASIENVATAGLGQLLDNGGAVLTCSPLDGSVLIGFGSNGAIVQDTFDLDHDGIAAELLPIDARGQLRIVGGTVDAGAVEQIVNEVIGGTPGSDTIFGGLGNDRLTGRQGNDLLDGGDGIDTADYSAATSGVTVNLALSTGQNVGAGLGVDTLRDIEIVLGSAHGDTLTGHGVGNTLKGGGGADTLVGGAGDDTLAGDAGADQMNGGLGNDTFYVDNAGDTPIEAAGQGLDEAFVSINSFSLFALPNVDRMQFTGGGNFVGRGNGIDNRIQGGAGDDRFVVDQGGADRYFGEAGVMDQMDYRLSAAGAIVNLTTGVHGGAAAGDFFSSLEYFYGSDTAGDNLTGAGFNDHFYGYAGADTLIGLGGTDYLNGGNGDDEIAGGALLDFLQGDTGADDFNYTALADSGPTSAARDRILDFVHNSDDIDVSAIDASAAGADNNAFTQFISAAGFTAEGQVRWYQSGANTVIEFNTSGVSGAEMQIQLQGFTAATLTQSDFIA
jgi:CSLREA domain-containing protein